MPRLPHFFWTLLLLALAVGQVRAQTGPIPKDKDKEAKKDGKLPDGKADGKGPVEPPKLPPGAVIAVVENLKDIFTLYPKLWLADPEELRSMDERIKALEKLLKLDRKAVSVCKLTGKLDGDTILLRADVFFSTERPNTTVFLGLSGALPTDEGDLDHGLPHLDTAEDGYVLKVEKPGSHHLMLNLVLPVGLKRGLLGGGGAERSLELGLPGAAVTTFHLELPPTVKEVRWNDKAEKRKGARWELVLGKEKTVSITWKEPIARSGGDPLQTADAQIGLKIEEEHLVWTVDLALEDLQGQTKEWKLLFPVGAKVEVKTAGASGYALREVEGQPHTHILELKEKGPERWVLHAKFTQGKPGSGKRLPVGPIRVLGAYREQGTITIQAVPGALRGQRLLFHRAGETYARDVPRTGNTVASFQYWGMPPAKGKMRTPLELEWKEERAIPDALVTHQLRLHSAAGDKILSLTSVIQMKGPHAGFLEVQLPTAFPWLARQLDFEALLPFPSGIPWLAALADQELTDQAQPLDFSLEGDGNLLRWHPPDALGKAKVEFLPGSEDATQIVLHGRYRAPADPGLLRVPLPAPLGVRQRGTKMELQGEEGVGFLNGGAAEAEHAARSELKESWDGPAHSLEFFWRRHLPAAADVDVEILDRSAHVTMHVKFPTPAKKGSLPGELDLDYPKGLNAENVDQEGLKHGDVTLRFDVDLLASHGLAAEEALARQLLLSFPWPKGTTHKKVNLRVWARGGMAVELDKTEPMNRAWKDREWDRAEAKGFVPSLCLHYAGTDPALRLMLHSDNSLEMLVDRALIRVHVDAKGNHEYRARFLVEKIYSRHLRLQLPLAPAACLEKILLDGKEIRWIADEAAFDMVRLNHVGPAHFAKPAILEVRYKVSAAHREGRRAWGTTFVPPRWQGEVDVSRVSWQISFPSAWFAMATGAEVRSDYSWGFVGWLIGPTPASERSADAWAGSGGDFTDPPTLTLEQPGLEPLFIVHFPRPVWLLICSGVVLFFGLVFFLLSLPRGIVWPVAFLLATGLVASLWLWPALLPALLYGAQPGLLALVALTLVNWLMQQSYKRQMVFLPGFTRVKTNSSLTRAAGKGEREASTVDAPVSIAAKPSTSQGS